MSEKIKEEVMKPFNIGFLDVTSYPQWVANVVPVPKKDGKVRMCVDYQNMNKASPKEDFPLPHIDVLVDNTTQASVFSFIGGFSGYNQNSTQRYGKDYFHVSLGHFLLQGDAFWSKERRGNLSTINGHTIS